MIGNRFLFVALVGLFITSAFVTATPQKKNCPLNYVCFVIDGSSSINDDEFDEQIDAVKKIATTLDQTSTVDTHYSAFIFGDSASVVQSSSLSLNVLLNELNSLSHPKDGSTNMYAGLNACYQELLSKSDNRVIVLLTDGEDNRTPRASALAPTIRTAGIKTVTVGIGNNVDDDYLRNLAYMPNFFTQTDFTSIVSDALQIANTVCDVIVVTDSCQEAYDKCDFKFIGIDNVPSYSISGIPDRPFTPRIVSRINNEIPGVLNTNNIVPEFIDDNGMAKPITNFGNPKLTPTHFKPFSIPNKHRFSGVGHQTFHGNQKARSRDRCVRIFFTHYQLLNSNGHSIGNVNGAVKSDNKCVVFRTS